MAKKEAYDQFPTLSEKLSHFIQIHGNKKTRHLSNYEIELLNLAIKKIGLSEPNIKNEAFQLPSEAKDPKLEEQILRDRVAILLDERNSNIVISKATGVSKSKVAKWKKEYIFKLLGQGVSAKKISRKFKVNYSIATKWRRQVLGITIKSSAETRARKKKKRSNAAKKAAKTRAENKKSKKKAKKSKYSKKFRAEAMRLIREGHSGVEVSNIMGVHKDTVRKWRKASGLTGESNTYSTSLQNDVLDLIREGKSNTEIAKLAQVSSTTVANWRRRFDKEGF